jgi:hypothetical protein
MGLFGPILFELLFFGKGGDFFCFELLAVVRTDLGESLVRLRYGGTDGLCVVLLCFKVLLGFYAESFFFIDHELASKAFFA